MRSLSLRSRIGRDGILRLEIPVGAANVDCDVVVVVEPVASVPPCASAAASESLGWSPGFFEETAGKWEGDPLVRPEQGEYEVREAL
jgi:hypothetical protein